MTSSERRQSIQTLLDIHGRVSVVELAEQYHVAQETIRRDIAKLEANGIARKVHGGAVSAKNKFEQTLTARFSQDIPEKHALARCAAALIPPGSTLFIDFGTTTNIFAEHIKELADLTVFTNSHLIAAIISENSSSEVFVLGGRYERKIKANMGETVIDGIREYFADFAVIGIGGVDKSYGFSVQNIGEAAVAKAMIGRSTSSIILADPSKFGRRGIAHVADFHQISFLVSSALPDDDICAALKRVNARISTP